MYIAKSYIGALIIGLLLSTATITGCNLSPSVPGDGNEQIIFQDDFKDSNSGWFVYKSDDTKGGKYDTGAYSVWVKAKTTIIALNPKTRQNFGDFTVTADVRKTSEGSGTALGIIYRMNNLGQHYRFAITDNQTFWVGKNAGEFEEQIYEAEFSSHINPAADGNRLKVTCVGPQQEVYANGYKLATITDNTSTKGELGMAFSNFGTATASYTFSNFRLSSAQK